MGTHTVAAAPARPAGRERAALAARADRARALDALRSIVRALRLNSHAIERRVGLTGAQLFVLQQLGAGPVRSTNELAARTLTHQSSVSAVVSRLVERGLAVRETSPADARRTEIALTALGRATLRRAPATVQARLVSGLDELSGPRLAALADALVQWTRVCGIENAAPPLFFEDAPPARKGRKRGQHAAE